VCLAVFDRQRRFLLHPGRARGAALSAVGAGAALLITQLTTGSEAIISESRAHRFPEFGPNGQMHFFASSTLDYLRQNYSGFALQESGSLLAVAAVLLLLVRPRNARRLRPEVWSMAVAAIVLFGAAHALLFRLYLPQRYTYPLLPFFCIAIAVSLGPTFAALAERKRIAFTAAVAFTPAVALLALTVFPLGPRLSLSDFASWLADASLYLVVGLAVGFLLAAVVWARESGLRRARAAGAAAVLAGALLLCGVAFAGGLRSPGAVSCRDASLYAYLRAQPKNTIVAADPFTADCIPIAARRPVVISRKLYQPWAVDYFRVIRERMFDTVDAYYGSSVGAVVKLRERYGADSFLVRKGISRHPWLRMQPFSGEVRRLRRSVGAPAIQKLPERCVTWRGGRFELYDLRCLAAGEPR
jgi:hypothetical protein